MKKPNIVFVFADQWRYQAFGYTGNKDVQTPNIDSFAGRSANLCNTVSGCPVCSPYRASLLTGQNPLTHGVIVNDVPVKDSGKGFGTIFKEQGYETAYIGKWHINGYGREAVIPKKRRFGFDYWKVLECSHSYFNSPYYDQDSDELSFWDGYDAHAQTRDAIAYMEDKRQENLKSGENKPFLLCLSWGPPHAPPPYLWNSPYDQFPKELEGLYEPDNLTVRENVPGVISEQGRKALEGYYSHCTALDQSFGELRNYLENSGLEKDTLFIFTSDHGDMLGSHGLWKKQVPFEESIRIPFLLKGPDSLGVKAGKYEKAVLEAQDVLPTILGLLKAPKPLTLEGRDYSSYLRGEADIKEDSALLACYQPFGQWRRDSDGGFFGFTGREYRGIRTVTHTYVVDKNGPWFLFDNAVDPYQLNNLISDPGSFELAADLDDRLRQLMLERNDPFLDGNTLVQNYGYTPEFARQLNPDDVELCLSNWGYETEGEHHE